MLPLFPAFKIIEIYDKENIEKINSQFPPYSDFNFASLFTWGVNRSARYTTLNKNLVIKIRGYGEDKFVYSILGSNDLKISVRELLNNHRIDRLELVPEEVVASLSGFSIKPQRDEDDYIYELKDLVSLVGPSYRNFRRSLTTFRKSDLATKAQTIIIDANNFEQCKEVLKVSQLWRSVRGRSFKNAAHEYYAIRRAVQYANQLDLVILGVYIDSSLVGYTITEVKDDWAILHFEKSLTSIPGIGSYVKYETFKKMNEIGASKLNYEQDLGISGLRQAKLSLSPSGFLKQYEVKLLSH